MKFIRLREVPKGYCFTLRKDVTKAGYEDNIPVYYRSTRNVDFFLNEKEALRLFEALSNTLLGEDDNG